MAKPSSVAEVFCSLNKTSSMAPRIKNEVITRSVLCKSIKKEQVGFEFAIPVFERHNTMLGPDFAATWISRNSIKRDPKCCNGMRIDNI